MGRGYLLPWMDQRFIQRHFYLKLQGIHRSCSSKIYYWHHQSGDAINCYYQMKIIKPLSGICSVGLGKPERGRKSIKLSADGYNHISSANRLFHFHMHISICTGSIKAMYHPYGYQEYIRKSLSIIDSPSSPCISSRIPQGPRTSSAQAPRSMMRIYTR